MMCFSCGMDSRTAGTCEWCRKPLGGNAATAGPSPLDLTQPVPAVQVQTRVALTGEVIEVPVGPPATSMPPPVVHAQVGAPAGLANRSPSVLPPTVAGLPHAAVSARMLSESRQPSVSAGERWERFLALALPLLLGAAWLIHLVPSSFIWVLLISLFAVGLLMGATRAIGSYDDAFLDCSVVLMACYFLGPVIGTAVYLVVGAIKQEVNGSMLALLAGHIVTRLLGHMALANVELSIGDAVSIGIANFLGFFYICASFAGWMLSSFFRPLNE
jgi:hypothetical protein